MKCNYSKDTSRHSFNPPIQKALRQALSVTSNPSPNISRASPSMCFTTIDVQAVPQFRQELTANAQTLQHKELDRQEKGTTIDKSRNNNTDQTGLQKAMPDFHDRCNGHQTTPNIGLRTSVFDSPLESSLSQEDK